MGVNTVPTLDVASLLSVDAPPPVVDTVPEPDIASVD